MRWICGLFICFSITGFSQSKLDIAIQRFVSDPLVSNATIGFMAYDLDSNKVIANINGNTSLTCASTTKLFTTATALSILGPDYRPKTRIYIKGDIDNSGVLQGDLWIRGGGDPTLGSIYFNAYGRERDFLKKWCDTLKKLGLKEINGSIIIDGSEFGYQGVPEGWSWSDIGNYYGAGASGICIFDNTVRYTFRTGTKPGSKAQLLSYWPEINGLNFHNYITAENVNGDNTVLYGSPFSLERFGKGQLPLNQSSFTVKGSMPDPEKQLSVELYSLLISNGITIKGDARSVREMPTSCVSYDSIQLLYTHKGPALNEIIRITNQRSVNLFAEAILCMIGYEKTGIGNTESGLHILETYWSKHINTRGLSIKDGSGLSRANAISCKNFCELLQHIQTDNYYEKFQLSLPIAGQNGTISNLCKGQAGHGRIYAKSGTMSRVKSYAGYIYSASGKKIAFAITVNNFTGKAFVIANKIEPILNALATY